MFQQKMLLFKKLDHLLLPLITKSRLQKAEHKFYKIKKAIFSDCLFLCFLVFNYFS